MRKHFYFLFVIIVFLSSCSSIPKVASSDKSYFLETPEIVQYETRYFLRWKYAKEAHFYMHAQSEIKNGQVVFFIMQTSSTGDAAGKLQFQEIKGSEELLKIKLHKAFWQEPNGNLSPLVFSPLKENEIIHALRAK